MIIKEIILTRFNLRLVSLKFQDQLLFVSISTKIEGVVVANAHFILAILVILNVYLAIWRD